MINLYIVTHTESIHHIEKLGGGWYDTSLTENGKVHASKIGEYLSNHITDDSPKIYSSDLKRASETANIIKDYFQSKVILDAGLREMSFGQAEGKPKDWQAAHIKPKPNNGNRLDHKVYENAESRRDVAIRITKSLKSILKDHKDQDIILVTHGFALTFIIMAWLKVPTDNMDYCNFTVRPGSITKLTEDDYLGNRGVSYLNKSVI